MNAAPSPDGGQGRPLIQRFPVPFTLTAVLIGAGLAAGAAALWRGQEKAGLEAAHLSELAGVRSDADMRVAEAATALLALEEKSAAIRRKVGQEELLLDVGAFLVGEGTRPEAPGYVGLQADAFFAAPPDGWSHASLEGRELLGRFGAGEDPAWLKHFSFLTNGSVELWQGSGHAFTVRARPNLRLQIFSFLSAELISLDQLRNDMRAFSFFQAKEFEAYERDRELARIVAEVRTALPVAAGSGQGMSPPADPGAPEKDGRTEILGTLERLFDGDLAGIAMGLQVQGAMDLAAATGAVLQVVDMQRRGNVSYVRTNIKFFDHVEGRSFVKMIWNREFFVVSLGRTALVVQTSLPSVDPEHEGFAWTQAWLESLRIPL